MILKGFDTKVSIVRGSKKQVAFLRVLPRTAAMSAGWKTIGKAK